MGVFISFSACYFAPCVSGTEAVAVTVETSYQNTGLALAIAFATFAEKDRVQAAGVPLYYGSVQIVCLPLFLLCAWKAGFTFAPPNIALHRVILSDFQPQDPMMQAKVAPVSPTLE